MSDRPDKSATPEAIGDEGQPDQPAPPAPSKLPDHRDMYVLVLGLVVGLILSPWVLGNHLPDKYKQWIRGGADEEQKLNEKTEAIIAERKQQADQITKRMTATGATTTALQEALAQLDQNLEAERLPYLYDLDQARQKRVARHRAMVAALLIACAVLMFFEPLFDPRGSLGAVRRRLATGRYGAMAIIIVFLVADPRLLSDLSIVFVALLLAVIGGAAAVPMLWTTDTQRT